jgi:iron complex outermembrane receptor protein
VSRSNPTETTGLLDGFFNYTHRMSSLNSELDATAGYSYEGSTGDYPSWYARGLSTNLLGVNGVPTAVEEVPSLYVKDSKLASFFGRVNYTIADRYLLTLSVRRDGSSRFGPGNQWGTFPAAAVGWRVNEEPWFHSGLFSDLKLRASWGVNGNQAIGDYLWVPTYTFSDPFARVQFGSDFVTTIRPTAVDPNIKWEQTKSYNLGVDYGLFDDRITGSVEYYVKNTDDLLFRIPVAAGTNLSNYVTTNIGSMRNKGLELSVNARVLDGGSTHGLSWNASFNASTNKNRLLRINPFGGSSQLIQVGGISGGVGSTIQVLEPGFPVNSFYVYQHKRDANGNPVADNVNGVARPDTAIYMDLNGDSVITQADRRPFHSSQPTWIFGHTSQFGYRNFDLGFTLRANVGNYVYNNVSSSQGYYNALKNAAGPVNLSGSVLKNNFLNPQYFSDVYVENASFLRMDNITLGYTLPHVRGVQTARLYGTIQNAFTLSGYSGVDPEAGLNGIDNNIYPRSRTFSAGVSIGF